MSGFIEKKQIKIYNIFEVCKEKILYLNIIAKWPEINFEDFKFLLEGPARKNLPNHKSQIKLMKTLKRNSDFWMNRLSNTLKRNSDFWMNIPTFKFNDLKA